MTSKTALMLGFGLPVLFAIVAGMFLHANGGIATNKKPQTNFYYATGVNWNIFNNYDHTYNREQKPFLVLNGRFVFPSVPGNRFLYDCTPASPTVTYLPNGESITVSKEFPDICSEKDTEKILKHVMAKGVKIYEHNVITNESRLMTSDEVVALQNINNTRRSVEGFEFRESGYRNTGMSDFFFGFSGSGNYYYGPYLARGSKVVKMNLRTDSQNEQVYFLGWAR